MNETVSILRLTVPKLEATKGVKPMDAQQIAAWLQALPIANVQQSATDIRDVLVQLNRTEIRVEQRFRIMELIGQKAIDIDAAMKKTREKTAFRPTERNRALALLHQTMLSELANGFKLIIVELLRTGEPGRVPKAMVIAMYRAIHFLCHDLLEAYVAYASDPPHIWGEIHRMYRFATQARIQNQPVERGPQNSLRRQSIEEIYRQIVLLYLANPYHLMQGEVYTIFDRLPAWLDGCVLEPVASGSEIAGQLYIDPERDAPPLYAPLDLPAKPLKALRVKVTGASEAVSVLIEAIEVQRRQNTTLTLIDRMQRDMLMRLHEAWRVRRERLSPRSPQMIKVSVTVGLGSCHNFINNEQSFHPEHDEHELGGQFGGDMSIVGDHVDSWASGAQSRSTTRSSIFESTEIGGNDHWDDVYSTPEKESLEARAHEQSFRQQFEVSHWDQHDVSEGGISLSCGSTLPDTMRVGEIVAYRPDTDQGSAWLVGSVRWMQFLPDRGLSLGIRKLSASADALGLRAIEGTGKGGEYFRAVMTAPIDSDPAANSLLVPAAIYDIDTLVLATTPDKLYYLRLVDLIETSRSYTRFSFEFSESPKAKYTSQARRNRPF